MRSLFAPYTSLTAPFGAGPGTPRTVIGSDIPAELAAYAAAVPIDHLTITSAILSYDAGGNYTYRAFARHSDTLLAELSGFVDSAGVVYPLTYTDFDIPSGNRLNYLSGGPGTYPGDVFVDLPDAFYASLLGGDIDAFDVNVVGDLTQGGPEGEPGGLVDLNIVTCRCFQATAQSIPDGGTGTAIAFTQADQDSHSGWDPDEPTRYTVPQGGVYEVVWGVAYATNSTGTRYAYIRINGSAATPIVRVAGVSGNPTTLTGVQYVPCNAGDYLELLTAQGSGGALNTAASLTVPLTLSYMFVNRLRGLVPS